MRMGPEDAPLHPLGQLFGERSVLHQREGAMLCLGKPRCLIHWLWTARKARTLPRGPRAYEMPGCEGLFAPQHSILWTASLDSFAGLGGISTFWGLAVFLTLTVNHGASAELGWMPSCFWKLVFWRWQRPAL